MALNTDRSLTHAVEVSDASQIGAARRVAARVAEGAALPAVTAGNLAIAVVELATNLVRHAKRGELLIQATGEGDQAVVDVVSIDRGPGMELERCLQDGYSTAGTKGCGLGAVQRLATTFDGWSDRRGSAVLARFGDAAAPALGVIVLPIRGELVSGDAWTLLPRPDGWTLVVCDGLGHGPHAQAAAHAALDALAGAPDDPVRFLELAHVRSAGTRGSACSVVSYASSNRQIVHAGVGNVAAVLVGPDGARSLASQNGTLGAACPRVQHTRLDAGEGALIVLHTDGLTARWSLDAYPGLRPRDPQLIAAVLRRDADRQRDDATIVVVRL